MQSPGHWIAGKVLVDIHKPKDFLSGYMAYMCISLRLLFYYYLVKIKVEGSILCCFSIDIRHASKPWCKTRLVMCLIIQQFSKHIKGASG